MKNALPNLLFMCQQFGVRSEVWMYRQAIEMKRSNVTVICREHWNQDSYPATDKTSVVEIPKAIATPPLIRTCGRNLVTRAITAGLNRWQNRKFDFYRGTARERKWLQTQLAQLNPRTTLFQYGTTAVGYAGLFHAMGRQYAIHFHGHDLSSAVRKPEYTRAIVKAANHSCALIVVARYMRDWLVDHGVPQEKVHIVPYGVPMDQFKPSEATADHSNVEFLMVGRLTPKKAPELTIRAFARCHQGAPNTSLKIIGDGELLPQCRATVDELGLGNAVEFLGSQTTEVVRRAMRNASVFVQHSVTSDSGDKEGWPVAVAEAAASGLPIVSTRHASIPEQVLDGESGLLCDELDWEKMSANMQLLATDTEKRRQLGKQARQHISQWDVGRQLEILESHLLESQPA